MSYIQLTIGGKPRGLKFNQMAVLVISQHIDYENLAATFGYAIVYGGLKANCYVKREEPDFDFEKVCEWVEEMSYDDLMKVKDAFESTQSYKTLTENVETSEKETKKKQRKIISKPTK